MRDSLKVITEREGVEYSMLNAFNRVKDGVMSHQEFVEYIAFLNERTVKEKIRSGELMTNFST